MKTAIIILTFIGFGAAIFAGTRSKKAAQIDKAVRDARDENLNKAFNSGVAPRLFP